MAEQADSSSASSPDELVAPGYAAALRELENLLADLEDDALDIDLLATKVERASVLIRFCRSRIDAARVQVDRIVADLEQHPDDPGSQAAWSVPADDTELDEDSVET